MFCLFPVPCGSLFFFFFNDTATTEIYTLSLHDALPISAPPRHPAASTRPTRAPVLAAPTAAPTPAAPPPTTRTSYLSFVIISSLRAVSCVPVGILVDRRSPRTRVCAPAPARFSTGRHVGRCFGWELVATEITVLPAGSHAPGRESPRGCARTDGHLRMRRTSAAG